MAASPAFPRSAESPSVGVPSVHVRLTSWRVYLGYGAASIPENRDIGGVFADVATGARTGARTDPRSQQGFPGP
jgi:hypothetical protein